jgi:hypothetical protein
MITNKILTKYRKSFDLSLFLFRVMLRRSEVNTRDDLVKLVSNVRGFFVSSLSSTDFLSKYTDVWLLWSLTSWIFKENNQNNFFNILIKTITRKLFKFLTLTVSLSFSKSSYCLRSIITLNLPSMFVSTLKLNVLLASLSMYHVLNKSAMTTSPLDEYGRPSW